MRCLFLLSIIHSIFLFNGVNAFPSAAGHCESGDLAGKYSPHGELGGGPLSNGQLSVHIGSQKLSSYYFGPGDPNVLKPNTLYTVTLSSNFSFRGFLFRLSGGFDVEGTLSPSDDPNVQFKSSCAPGISAVTHTHNLDKSSVSFNFEYTASTSDSLLLEVTVMKTKAENNWFYSSFDLTIVDDIAGTETPSVTPSEIPSSIPSFFPSSKPSEETSVRCEDSKYKFKTMRPSDRKKIWGSCKWVRKKTKRCAWKNVSGYCSLTCNTCDICQDAKGKFKFKRRPTDTSKTIRNCRWTKKEPAGRCAIEGMKNVCRATCDQYSNIVG